MNKKSKCKYIWSVSLLTFVFVSAKIDLGKAFPDPEQYILYIIDIFAFLIMICALIEYRKNYTKHHLKFGKNQADNLAYIGFRR